MVVKFDATVTRHGAASSVSEPSSIPAWCVLHPDTPAQLDEHVQAWLLVGWATEPIWPRHSHGQSERHVARPALDGHLRRPGCWVQVGHVDKRTYLVTSHVGNRTHHLTRTSGCCARRDSMGRWSSAPSLHAAAERADTARRMEASSGALLAQFGRTGGTSGTRRRFLQVGQRPVDPS